LAASLAGALPQACTPAVSTNSASSFLHSNPFAISLYLVSAAPSGACDGHHNPLPAQFDGDGHVALRQAVY
jgi:hypothetical protein